MGTPVKPEVQTPENQSQNQNLNQTQENTEQPTENLPTVTPITGKTYTEADMQAIHNLYGTALREKEQEVNSFRQNQNTNNNQPTYNPEQDSQQLLTDPRRLIRDEINQAIAPLADGLKQFQAMSVYDSLKNQFRAHPNYASYFNVPGFESSLDQVMQGVSPVTVQIIQQAITQVVGYMVTNNLWNPAPAPSNNNNGTRQVPIPNQNNNQNNNQPNNGNTNMLPAHLRPSGAPAPNGGNSNLTPKGNIRRALSENEKRIARERHMTDDTYIDWLNESSTNVVKSDIGRPAK